MFFHSPSTSPFKYHLNRTSIVLQMTIRPLFCGELPCDAVEINDTKSPKTAPRHHWAAEWRDREVRPAESARRFRPMAAKRRSPRSPDSGAIKSIKWMFPQLWGYPKIHFSNFSSFFHYKTSVLVIDDIWKPQNKHLKKNTANMKKLVRLQFVLCTLETTVQHSHGVSSS